MRRPFIAGNWKMNTRSDSGASLVGDLVAAVGDCADCDVAVCPPSVYLASVASVTKGTAVGLGGQNLYAAGDGAYTGEVNADMLIDVGCKYVILGHSERRALMGEDDAAVSQKLHASLDGGLVPIVCVGETLEERESDKTTEVVSGQIRGSLKGLTAEQAAGIVVAYEPVWAIGTGKTASPEQAEEVHAMLRGLLAELFGQEVADQIRLQYGGSVKPGNAAELLSQPNIDGALVGGASLKADDFAAIIQAASA